MTRRLCGRLRYANVPRASCRGCRGHVLKAQQHAPRTLLAQPLGRRASLPLRSRDPQTAETWKATVEGPLSHRRSLRSRCHPDEHSGDAPQRPGHVIAAKVSLTSGRNCSAPGLERSPLHPLSASPSATHYRPEVRTARAPRPKRCGVRLQPFGTGFAFPRCSMLKGWRLTP